MIKRHIKRCSNLFIIREMQNYKTTKHQNYNEVPLYISQQSLQITNSGEDVEKRESSYIVGGNGSLYTHYGKQYGGSLKN